MSAIDEFEQDPVDPVTSTEKRPKSEGVYGSPSIIPGSLQTYESASPVKV